MSFLINLKENIPPGSILLRRPRVLGDIVAALSIPKSFGIVKQPSSGIKLLSDPFEPWHLEKSLGAERLATVLALHETIINALYTLVMANDSTDVNVKAAADADTVARSQMFKNTADSIALLSKMLIEPKTPDPTATPSEDTSAATHNAKFLISLGGAKFEMYGAVALLLLEMISLVGGVVASISAIDSFAGLDAESRQYAIATLEPVILPAITSLAYFLNEHLQPELVARRPKADPAREDGVLKERPSKRMTPDKEGARIGIDITDQTAALRAKAAETGNYDAPRAFRYIWALFPNKARDELFTDFESAYTPNNLDGIGRVTATAYSQFRKASSEAANWTEIMDRTISQMNQAHAAIQVVAEKALQAQADREAAQQAEYQAEADALQLAADRQAQEAERAQQAANAAREQEQAAEQSRTQATELAAAREYADQQQRQAFELALAAQQAAQLAQQMAEDGGPVVNMASSPADQPSAAAPAPASSASADISVAEGGYVSAATAISQMALPTGDPAAAVLQVREQVFHPEGVPQVRRVLLTAISNASTQFERELAFGRYVMGEMDLLGAIYSRLSDAEKINFVTDLKKADAEARILRAPTVITEYVNLVAGVTGSANKIDRLFKPADPRSLAGILITALITSTGTGPTKVAIVKQKKEDVYAAAKNAMDAGRVPTIARIPITDKNVAILSTFIKDPADAAQPVRSAIAGQLIGDFATNKVGTPASLIIITPAWLTRNNKWKTPAPRAAPPADNYDQDSESDAASSDSNPSQSDISDASEGVLGFEDDDSDDGQ